MPDNRKENSTAKSGLGRRMQDVGFEILPAKEDKPPPPPVSPSDR
jgi:hypothetical protein